MHSIPSSLSATSMPNVRPRRPNPEETRSHLVIVMQSETGMLQTAFALSQAARFRGQTKSRK